MDRISIKKTGEELFYEKLANGLEVYMLPNKKVKNFYITLNTKFGSLHTNFVYKKEKFELPKGAAHFLEHLAFNMPDGSTAFEYYTKLGSNINAFTSYDITCYEVFANSKFKENLDYLLTYVYTPHFTKEMINNEKGVIIEEIKQIGDNPNSELVYGLYRNLFVNDQHQYLISGTIDDVKKITLKDIESAYNAFYHPKNMFLIITGNFLPEEAIAIINENMKNKQFNNFEKPLVENFREPFKVKEEYLEKIMPVEKHKISIGYKIPKQNFKALKLSDLELKLYINLIIKINFGSTSLLREELVSNGIIANGISTHLMLTDDYLVECFMGSTDYPDYFIKRIQEKFESLKVSEEEINRKIKTAISNLVLNYDEIEAVNADIQDDVLNYGESITNIYDYYRNMDVEIANKIIDKLKNSMHSVLILKPKENEE